MTLLNPIAEFLNASSLSCFCLSCFLAIGIGAFALSKSGGYIWPNDKLISIFMLIGMMCGLLGILVFSWANFNPLQNLNNDQMTESVKNVLTSAGLSEIANRISTVNVANILDKFKGLLNTDLKALTLIPVLAILDRNASIWLILFFLMNFLFNPLVCVVFRLTGHGGTGRIIAVIIFVIVQSALLFFFLTLLGSFESIGLGSAVTLREIHTVLDLRVGPGLFFTILSVLLSWLTLVDALFSELVSPVGQSTNVKKAFSPGRSGGSSLFSSAAPTASSASSSARNGIFGTSSSAVRKMGSGTGSGASNGIFGGTSNSSRPSSTVGRASGNARSRANNHFSIGQIILIGQGVFLLLGLFMLPVVVSGGETACKDNVSNVPLVADMVLNDMPQSARDAETLVCGKDTQLVWWWEMVAVSGLSTIPFALGILILAGTSIGIGLWSDQLHGLIVAGLVAVGMTLGLSNAFNLSTLGGGDFWVRLLSSIALINVSGWYWLLLLCGLLILPAYYFRQME